MSVDHDREHCNNGQQSTTHQDPIWGVNSDGPNNHKLMGAGCPTEGYFCGGNSWAVNVLNAICKSSSDADSR